MTTRRHAGLRLNNPFLALRHRNFRYYWIGMCVSMSGTWMQNIAQPWLAYKLTSSPMLLSFIGALQFLPVLLFSLFAGAIVDKLPKKRILLFTQSCSMVITLVLFLLVWSGRIQYWHILITSASLGFVNTLDMPSRQSFFGELVPQEDLMDAIALNSTVFNLSRIVGPAAAGLIMGQFGIAFCFLVNSVSFAAVLISLFFIHPVTAPPPREAHPHLIADIKDGLRYIAGNRTLHVALLILLVVTTFIPNFDVLVPVFATKVLHQQETGYGFLMSFMGAGSFVGALLVAMWSKSGPKRAILYLVPVAVGALLALAGSVNVYPVAAVLLAFVGFTFVMFSSNANSTVQLASDKRYRGRVMSVYSLIFGGSTPFGNLYAGFFTDRFGPRVGFWACGGIVVVLMIVLDVVFYRRYVRENA